MLDSVLHHLKGHRLSKADQIHCGLISVDEETKDKLEDQNGLDEDLGPTSTWPLGDILVARHDLCHVRLFNS